MEVITTRTEGSTHNVYIAYGQVYREEYLDAYGQYHRLDGPALIIDEHGDHIENWYLHGELHCDGEPAAIHIAYDPFLGVNTRRESWYQNDKLHRDGGPAEVEYIGPREIYERWCVYGVEHRENGPAYICYGTVMTCHVEIWRKHGEIHRDDGPAIINHTMDIKQYYQDGHLLRRGLGRHGIKPPEYRQALLALPPPIFRRIWKSFTKE